tara:strand:+ start:304 stop:552 length:249 start_codon:yes stop_codon:yes gene_type:complete
MERKYTILNGDEVIEQGKKDVSWETVRKQRDRELKSTDWWALKDLTMSQAKKDYRAFLRNLPQNYETANDAADAWAEYEKPE